MNPATPASPARRELNDRILAGLVIQAEEASRENDPRDCAGYITKAERLMREYLFDGGALAVDSVLQSVITDAHNSIEEG